LNPVVPERQLEVQKVAKVIDTVFQIGGLARTFEAAKKRRRKRISCPDKFGADVIDNMEWEEKRLGEVDNGTVEVQYLT